MNETRDSNVAGSSAERASETKAPTPRQLALRIILWFFLVVSIFFFIAIMWGGLKP